MLFDDISLFDFDDDSLKNAKAFYANSKTGYPLTSARNDPKMVFISIRSDHARLFIVPQQPAMNLLRKDKVEIGEKFDSLDRITQFRKTERIPDGSWACSYEITLIDDKYYLARSQDGDMSKWTRSSEKTYFVGYTRLGRDELDTVAIGVLLNNFQEKYKLTLQDCLEFAKRFSAKVAIHENNMSLKDIQSICSSIVVWNGQMSLVEYSSRNSEASGQTGASSYASSRRYNDFFYPHGKEIN